MTAATTGSTDATTPNDRSAGRVSATGQDPASGPEAGTAALRGDGLRLAYGDRIVADGLDLEIPAGQVTALVGPNACGKSTALRALARLLKPAAGAVYLDGERIADLAGRDLARRLALLPQTPTAPDGITVRDLVARGRTPHQRWWRQWSSADDRVVDAALEATGVAALAARSVDELSGGQRQRVWIAMTLAQDTSLLLLDEPTTYLDLAHQVDVLELVTELNRADGRTVVMVLHELNHACRYADHLIAMRDGRVVAAGPPGEIVTAELVREVFGLQAVVIDCPVAGTPLVVPVSGRRERGEGAAAG
ncbi:ABC transporter ATP-binding protein [Allostreptomyces psammosilenae]|uniref:Iron complex transport system ATP-binding protein n=1 Tax=Allostreptomyces psammosilenae TaxID=1892865 RepID=A0A853A383_9ACTN|nr:iron complex transport system ATP-binding protein [Allostreptomyces psammosilenae]